MVIIMGSPLLRFYSLNYSFSLQSHVFKPHGILFGNHHLGLETEIIVGTLCQPPLDFTEYKGSYVKNSESLEISDGQSDISVKIFKQNLFNLFIFIYFILFYLNNTISIIMGQAVDRD